MGRQVLVVGVALIVMIGTAGCVCGTLGSRVTGIRGSGRVVDQVRDVSGFSGVDLETSGTLYIEPGTEDSLRVSAQGNLLDYIETDVRNGTLHIATRPNTVLNPTRPIQFYLTARALEAIGIAGSGDVQASDLQASQFTVTLSGSGRLQMQSLDADALKVLVGGSGKATLSTLRANTVGVDISGSGGLDISGGEVQKQDIVISGSGEYSARGLASAEAAVRLSGSGQALLNVSDNLQVTLSGSGQVRYVGSPTVSESVTGSGSVRQIRE